MRRGTVLRATPLAASRPAAAAAALAAARHLLGRAAHPESALRLAAILVTAEGAAEAALALLGPLVFRLVDDESATAEVLSVQLFDGGLRLLLRLDVDEGEAARLSRVLVGDDLDGNHLPIRALEHLADLLLGGVVRQVSDVQPSRHDHLLSRLLTLPAPPRKGRIRSARAFVEESRTGRSPVASSGRPCPTRT